MTVLSRRQKTRPVRVVVSGEEADGRESPHMVVPFLAVPGKATGSTPEGKENFDRAFGWAFDPPCRRRRRRALCAGGAGESPSARHLCPTARSGERLFQPSKLLRCLNRRHCRRLHCRITLAATRSRHRQVNAGQGRGLRIQDGICTESSGNSAALVNTVPRYHLLEEARRHDTLQGQNVDQR